MYKVKHGGDVQRGDLIAVSNGNDFSIGIYYGRGIGGTIQYYYPSSAPRAKEGYENRLLNHGIEKVGPFTLGHLYKAYINTPRDTRIIKLNRENITDQQEIENILEAREILKQFNITVNY